MCRTLRIPFFVGKRDVKILNPFLRTIYTNLEINDYFCVIVHIINTYYQLDGFQTR